MMSPLEGPRTFTGKLNAIRLYLAPKLRDHDEGREAALRKRLDKTCLKHIRTFRDGTRVHCETRQGSHQSLHHKS